MFQTTNLVGFGAGAAGGGETYRYFRINVTAVNSGASTVLTQMEIRIGGTDQEQALHHLMLFQRAVGGGTLDGISSMILRGRSVGEGAFPFPNGLSMILGLAMKSCLTHSRFTITPAPPTSLQKISLLMGQMTTVHGIL